MNRRASDEISDPSDPPEGNVPRLATGSPDAMAVMKEQSVLREGIEM